MPVRLVSISGEPVQVSSISVSGQPVTISGNIVSVQSGLYVASGLYVVADIAESGMGVQIQSGAEVIVQSGVYVSSGLMVDSATLASESAVTLLRRIVKLLEPSDVQDHMQRQRILIDDFRYSGYVAPVIATLPIVGAVSGVSLVTTVTNVGVSGICGNQVVFATSGPIIGGGSWQPVWIGPVENRWFIADQARASYAAGIRKNIWVV